MSSEVKRRQNSGNIECLRPGGGASKNRVAQCHRHGRNKLAGLGKYCGRLLFYRLGVHFFLLIRMLYSHNIIDPNWLCLKRVFCNFWQGKLASFLGDDNCHIIISNCHLSTNQFLSESNHWLCLSLTDSLTQWLRGSFFTASLSRDADVWWRCWSKCLIKILKL